MFKEQEHTLIIKNIGLALDIKPLTVLDFEIPYVFVRIETLKNLAATVRMGDVRAMLQTRSPIQKSEKV